MAGRLEEGDVLSENHEINVTPFIDVMLVLLIIFMVAAPLATVDIKVDLPAAAAAAAPQAKPDKPVFLTIQADSTLAVGNEQVAASGLVEALNQVTAQNTEARVFLRADKSINYDTLMQTINLLQGGGYLKVALVGLETVPQ